MPESCTLPDVNEPVFTPDADALATVRSITTDILQTASARPDLLQDQHSALAIQESLLLAIDEMFRRSRTSELPGRIASRSYCRLVRTIDEYDPQIAHEGDDPPQLEGVFGQRLTIAFGVDDRAVGCRHNRAEHAKSSAGGFGVRLPTR